MVGYKVESFTPSVFLADACSAMCVATAVSVPISIIDYAIISKIAKVTPTISGSVVEGSKILFSTPRTFFLPQDAYSIFKPWTLIDPTGNPNNHRSLVYWVCTTVYFWTYLTNNATMSYMQANGNDENSIRWSKGLVSGGVNTVLTMWKDTVILMSLPRVPGAKGKPYVPWFSRGLFCVRDVGTCCAAFTLAPYATDYLNDYYKNKSAVSSISNSNLAQICVPAAIQILSTFIHITSIVYQRNYPSCKVSHVTESIRMDYLGTLCGRICRIIPAFGIGGIGNTYLLADLAKRAEGK